MPIHIDEIESDIQLESGGAEGSAQTRQPASAPDSGMEAIERRARDTERTRAWDFDD